MNIYQIDEAIQNAFNKAIDIDTGEIVDEDAFLEMPVPGAELVTNYSMTIK